MQIIAIANQKGGTGKSTTAAALAQAAAADGKKTLAIDLDRQGNFSFSLAADMRKGSSFELLEGKPAAQLVQRSSTGPDVIPASRKLSTLTSSPGSALRLRAALKPLRREYDLVIIDTPTGAGEQQFNALMAATMLLIPLHAELYSLQGLEEMAALADQAKKNNPALKQTGIVITEYSGRSNIKKMLHENILEAANALGFAYYGTIRGSTPLQEAFSLQKNFIEYAPKNPATLEYLEVYRNLTEEK